MCRTGLRLFCASSGHPNQRMTANMLARTAAVKTSTKPKKKKAKKKLLPPQKPWLAQTALHTPSPQQGSRLPPGSPRLVGRAEVEEMIGHDYTSIWTWMRQGKFPRSRIAGGKSVWFEREIVAWMNSLPVRRLKGDA
jgi:predicted DNA-binding transcriptional regulator AlpA